MRNAITLPTSDGDAHFPKGTPAGNLALRGELTDTATDCDRRICLRGLVH